MADTRTSDETAAAALDGTELVRGVQGGSNVKMTTQAIADLGGGSALRVQSLTTNSGAPTDCDPANFDVIEITTDGSGSPQIVNVPHYGPVPTSDVSKALLFYVVTLTDPSDELHLTTSTGGADLTVYAQNTSDIPLEFWNDVFLDGTYADGEWVRLLRRNNGSWALDAFNTSEGGATKSDGKTFVPTGGFTGQVLAKNSDDTADISWVGGFTGDKVVGAETWTFVEGRLTAIV